MNERLSPKQSGNPLRLVRVEYPNGSYKHVSWNDLTEAERRAYEERTGQISPEEMEKREKVRQNSLEARTADIREKRRKKSGRNGQNPKETNDVEEQPRNVDGTFATKDGNNPKGDKLENEKEKEEERKSRVRGDLSRRDALHLGARALLGAGVISFGGLLLNSDKEPDIPKDNRSPVVTDVVPETEENEVAPTRVFKITPSGENTKDDLDGFDFGKLARAVFGTTDNGGEENVNTNNKETEVSKLELPPDKNKETTSEESEGVLDSMLDGARKWFDRFTKSDESVNKSDVPPKTKIVEKKPMPLEWHLAQNKGKITNLEEVLRGEFQSSLDYFKTADGAKDLNTAFENMMEKDLYLITKPFTDIGVPSSIVYALLVKESRAQNVTSDQEAVGWFQITLYPGRYYGLRIGKDIDERKDVYKSAIAAAKLLADELIAFNGDLDLALHAYNRGRTLGVDDEVTSYDVEDRTIDIYYNAVTGKLNKRLKSIKPTTIKSYTVKAGDSVSRIARELGSSVGMMVEANDLADPNKIYPDLVLKAPTYFNVREDLQSTLEGPLYVTEIKAAEKAIEEAGHLASLEAKRKADEVRHKQQKV